ncbi:MAG: two-component regulator propeller domain-containing protein, partial [Anaerolineales bacterium]
QSVAGSPFIGNADVLTIAEDRQGALWIGTASGLFEWNRSKNQLTEYNHDTNNPNSLSDNSVTCFLKDSKGGLWFGTRKGLDLFDKTQNRFVNYIHDPNDPNSLVSDSIRSIYEDRSGVMWIGTSGGLDKYAPATQKFALYQHYPGISNSLSDNNIWSINEDHLGSLWVGSFFAGLDRLDPNTGTVTVYQNKPGDPTSLSSNEIRSILEDHNGNLWVGMERGGLARFDPGTGTFTSYRHDSADPNSLSNDDVFSIFEDHLGKLWIGTQRGGLNRFDQATWTFTHYQHDASDPASLSDDQVRAITEDHTGILWIGTFGGVDLWDGHTSHFTVYRNNPKNPSSLSSDEVSCIFEDPSGTMWIGTFGGGLNRFDRATHSFTNYNEKDGLPDDTIYGILADPSGNLWLSTNKGLSKFDPTTKTFRNYDISDGLQGDQFNPGSFFQSRNGEMFFGGTQGLNAFYPAQVVDNPTPPPLVITAFQKYNKTVQTDLTANETIQLSYRDNFISFDFSALDYNAPGKNQYAYKLEGVDQDWVYAGTRRYASYTNLGGGNYTFRVKASNNDGVWNSEGTAIRIHIMPPFWQTWWFIGMVCLVAGAGAFGGYRLRVRDVEARNRELAKRVEQRTHDLAILNAITGVVNRSLDLKEVMQDALERTMEVTQMTAGSALTLDEATQELILIAYSSTQDTNISLGARWPLASALAGKSLEGTHPLVWKVKEDYPEGILKANLLREGIQLVVGVPLIAKEKMVGMLVLNTRTPRVLTQEELVLLEAVGQQVGMAVENARLYEQAEQTAIATERSRLARELHDSVTQLLYSVTLYAEATAELLDSGETKTAAGHLRELRDTAQEALREMRLLIFELHRPELVKSGLAATLQARLDAVERRGGMHAELVVEGSEQISRPVQAELYNIAQEALNNALKHAHAHSVRIHLRFGEADTKIQIYDDGTGFEPAADGMRGGFGIPGMQERSQKIGGSFQIVSTPGKGTTVIVRVPVNAHEHPAQTGTRPPHG